MSHQMNLLSLEARLIVLHTKLQLHAYELFNLLRRTIALGQQLFAEEILERINGDNDCHKCLVSVTKHLFMYPGKSISVTFKYGDYEILIR